MSYDVSYARTICLGYCYLTRLIPRRDLSLFLSFSGTCDTGEVASGHVRFERYRSASRAENHLGRAIRSAPRMDLGHSAGSDPLNRPRVGTAHTPALRAPKRKTFSSQPTRVGGERARPACNLRPTLDGCNWIFRFVRSASRWRLGTVQEIPIAKFCRISGTIPTQEEDSFCRCTDACRA